MKILYGVQGTGNGHITRARMMAKSFAEVAANNKLEVTFFFSGRDKDQYFDMECFGDYRCQRGLTFVTKAGAIHPIKTLLHNNIFVCLKDIIALDLEPYDLIITDYEPITAWAGKLRKKKVLGLGHQYAFNHDIPTAGKNIVVDNIMRHFAPATIGLGLHWHHFGFNILPPIIDNQAKRNQSNDKVLVYLPFENQHTVTALLNGLPEYQFIQYSPELVDNEQHNVSIRKTCHDNFKRDLASAKAVICNAGFGLVSECLNMHLPVMAKPVKGQIEQLSNAKALQQLGYAQTLENLDAQLIQQWLDGEKTTPAIRFPNVAKAIVDWILETQCQHPEKLTQKLWANTLEPMPSPCPN